MKTKKWGMFGVVTLFIVLVGVQVSALSVFVPGNVYQTLTDNGKTKYVVGVIDGLAVSGMEPFVECSYKLEPLQARAIVDKYMKDNPEHWHYGMSWIIKESLKSFCLKRVKETGRKS